MVDVVTYEETCPVCDGTGKAGPVPGAGDDWWYTDQPEKLPHGQPCPNCAGKGSYKVQDDGISKKKIA